MGEGVFTYSIVEVSREQVLTKIAQYGHYIHAVKISDESHIDCMEIPIKTLKQMTQGTEYLYFYVKKKEEK